MFTDKELNSIVNQGTVDFIEKKMKDVLGSKEEPDADYIRDLQTFLTLKTTVNQKIQHYRSEGAVDMKRRHSTSALGEGDNHGYS